MELFKMKILIALFFPVLMTNVLLPENKLVEIRELYYQAAINENAATKFMNTLDKMDVNSNAVLKGYKGMAYMIQANYSWNPYSKLRNFVKGKALLEEAIQKDSRNVELRFLRYCVQSNAPFFLGYRDNLQADKAMILKNWESLPDADLKQRIKEYMSDSDACSPKEKSIFNQ